MPFLIIRRFTSVTQSPFTMKVLNVAEKNAAAKNIAFLLSKGTAKKREGLSKYNKIYDFSFHIFNRNCQMIMTSVSGHLLGYEFTSLYRAWNSCDPASLFHAPIFKQCASEQIQKTLEREVKSCSKLIIWTDCDREGENIGFEIINVCKAVKPDIQVHRAQFSEITSQSVFRAVSNLQEPDKNASDAVDVRQELDLRIGAAFTRFQTLHLKQKFPNSLQDALISYGSCQFPTLGFVVERYKAIEDFIPETFWKIKVSDVRNGLSVVFNWARNRLFNDLACKVLYEACMENPVATVENLSSKPKTKWRPKPLDTVEMEKLVSRKLKINAKRAMTIAEKLYMQGFISYPRTETNIFPKEMNLNSLVEQHISNANWGEFAQKVLNDGANPNQGKKSDKAHPPIHPTKAAPDLAGDEKRMYEFIVRHFLACVSKNAEGLETTVEISIAGEKFTATGLIIIAKNYLEVYPYEKWDAKEIHEYHTGDTFTPEIRMDSGETSPPNLLTESDLIALMDKHGIGTDATHAEHIETIKARFYVGLNEGKYFLPKPLGMGLVDGYDNMGFEMSKPHLRAGLETDLKLICDGLKQPRDVLREQIAKYEEIFLEAQRQVQQLERALQDCLGEQSSGQVRQIEFNQLSRVSPCPKCSSFLVLKPRREDFSGMITCSGYPVCREAIWLPSFVISCETLDETCPTCGPTTQMLDLRFSQGSTYLPSRYKGCIGGCDSTLLDVLRGPPGASQSQSSAPPLRPTDSNRSIPPRVSTETSPNCNCGVPAILLVAKKAGPNQGRQFYKCNTQQGVNGCSFFQWADVTTNSVAGPGGGQPRLPPRGGPLTSLNPIGPVVSNTNTEATNRDADVNCNCGAPAVRLTVRKDGANRGRSFLGCSKPMGDPSKCQFFQWCDGSHHSETSSLDYSIPNHDGSGRGRGRGRRAAPYLDKSSQPRKKRKCGICREEGHSKNTCPNR